MSSQPTVLVVDDEEQFKRNVREVLESTGYRVRTAENAMEAVAEAEMYQPELILLNILMPEINALSFLHAMRKDEKLRETPVIVISDKDAMKKFRTSALDAGADAFLEKPFMMRELLITVVKYLPVSVSV